MIAMLIRLVNFLLFILYLTVGTLGGKDAPVNKLDNGVLDEVFHENFDFSDNSEVKRQTRSKEFSSKLNRSEYEKPGVQELSEFFVGEIKCTRFCVEKKYTEVKQEGTHLFLNLIWTFANEADESAKIPIPRSENILIPEIIRRNTTSRGYPRKSSKRCQLYLVVDCDIPKGSESLLNEKEKLFIDNLYPNSEVFKNNPEISDESHKISIQGDNLFSRSETKFHVEDHVESLNVIIMGNISKIDLEIPIDNQEISSRTDETTKTAELMLSLTRMTETMGVRLNVRNPQSGEWSLKFTPVKSSNYSFVIRSNLDNHKTGNKFDPIKNGSKVRPIPTDLEEFIEKQKFDEDSMTYDTISDRMDYEGALESRVSATSVLPELPHEPGIGYPYSNKFFSALDDMRNWNKQTRQWRTRDDANEEQLIPSSQTQSYQIQSVSSNVNNTESSETKNLNSRIAIPEPDYLTADMNNPFMKMMTGPQMEDRGFHESLELEDLARSPTDNFLQKKSLTIDVSSDTNLVVRAGDGRVRLNFDVRNNLMMTSKICYAARSSPFPAVNLIPSNPIERYCNAVGPGQVVTILVEIVVPPGVSDTINTVTITAQIQGFGTVESVEKSANVYVQNSNLRKIDDTRPTMYYYFNNNCFGRLRDDRCSKSIWSVDITVQDVDSGLKLVTSSPHGLVAHTDYVSGTTNPVTFFYYSTCCHRSVDISAVDMYGNYHTRRIEVTEWSNLSDGEIIAVVMGILFLILLIITIVLLIAYCIKRRKSRDLTYTQRYGSRPPGQRPERTSF